MLRIVDFPPITPEMERGLSLAAGVAMRVSFVPHLVPAVRGVNTRIELRTPDPSCNPYLALAVMLRAGLDGIDKQIDPGPPVNKNIYKMSHRERRHLRIDGAVLATIVRISGSGVVQAFIGTVSWLGLVRVLSTFGSSVLAALVLAERSVAARSRHPAGTTSYTDAGEMTLRVYAPYSVTPETPVEAVAEAGVKGYELTHHFGEQAA